ncbi:MAG TPA: enoyl-CoA hydratase-related protein, partial [Phenylobacterium sp.]|nr:enoyl-CoA hydratase-related protein [Phenylobacterium sp.]
MSNPIADPLVEGVDSDASSALVRIAATAEGVVEVVLNRPERKNAFDAALIAALHEAFLTLHGSEHVRVVFIRGAG